MRSREVPTWLVFAVGLASGLALGVAGGLLAGERWADDLRVRRLRARVEAAREYARRSDSAGWKRDSVRHAEMMKRIGVPPREVSRMQAGIACIVRFEVRDTIYRHLSLFDVRATTPTGELVAPGAAYSPTGFDVGDTITVVLPDAECGRVTIMQSGARWVGPSPYWQGKIWVR